MANTNNDVTKYKIINSLEEFKKLPTEVLFKYKNYSKTSSHWSWLDFLYVSNDGEKLVLCLDNDGEKRVGETSIETVWPYMTFSYVDEKSSKNRFEFKDEKSEVILMDQFMKE